MDPKWQALFYLLALLCFIAEAAAWRPRTDRLKPQFGWLGLAFFTVPFLYAAIVAGW